MIPFTTFEALAIAFGLGLLVGLQRQRVHKSLAGIRTFPLITVFGTICALLAQQFSYLVTARKLYINIKNMMLCHIFEMKISANFMDNRPFGSFLPLKSEIGKIFIPEKSSNVLFLRTLSSFRASTI